MLFWQTKQGKFTIDYLEFKFHKMFAAKVGR